MVIKTNMKTELKDVLHLYLGCDVQTKIRIETSEGLPMKKLKGRFIDVDLFLIGKVGIHLENETHPTDTTNLYISDIKPILRPLSDITDEELKPFIAFGRSDINEFINNEGGIGMYPYEFITLLKMKFDLFGLIESGQAIDKTQLF